MKLLKTKTKTNNYTQTYINLKLIKVTKLTKLDKLIISQYKKKLLNYHG